MNPKVRRLLVISDDQMTITELREVLPARFALESVDPQFAEAMLIARSDEFYGALIDRAVGADQAVALIKAVEVFCPQVQCIVAILERDFDRMVSIKNQVTMMKVAMMPWQERNLEALLDEVIEKNRIERHRMSWLSTILSIDQQTLLESRVQMLGAFLGIVTGSKRGKLLDAAAKVSQRGHHSLPGMPANLKPQANDWDLKSAEAIRTGVIARNIMQWWNRFEATDEPSRLVPGLTIQPDGSLMCQEMAAQLEAFSGKHSNVPKESSCGLLAFMLWREAPLAGSVVV